LALSLVAGCGGGGGGATGGGNAMSRNVDITVTASGVRGYVPIQVRGGNVSDRPTAVGDSTLSVSARADRNVQISAPDGYADRQFIAWRQGGQDIAAAPTMTFTPASLPSTEPLTAVYGPRTMPEGGFAPNYRTAGAEFPHWKQFPVRVYLDGSIPAGSTDEVKIREGMDRWVNAMGGTVSYQTVGSRDQADVVITYGDVPGNGAGMCDTAWNGRNQMTSATITLDPPRGNMFQETPQNLETLVSHEFGHALGLTGSGLNVGHSNDSSDTMFATGNSENGIITQRDANTLSSCYPHLFNGNSGRASHARSADAHGTPDGDGLFHARVF
jgi:hypothetical protein